MSKTTTKQVAAVTRAASLAARALVRLETEADRIMRETNGGHALRMVASNDHVSGFIRARGITVRFENGVFSADLETPPD